MNLKNNFYQLFLILFSYFIPKKKNLVIFGSGDSNQFQGNPKYMFLVLCNANSNIEFYWSSKKQDQFDDLKRRNFPVINPYSFTGFIKLLRSKYLVIEKSSYDVYYVKNIIGRFNFIQTWHGTPFKKIGIDAYDHKKGDIQFKIFNKKGLNLIFSKLNLYSRLRYKMIVSTSEAVSKYLQGAFENKNTVITGYPRNDVLFDSKLLYNNHAEELKINNYNKVILYAPTFRDNKNVVSPFSELLGKFNEQLRAKNYLFLVKKHPWEKVINIPNNLSNVVDVSTHVDDIQELLPCVDLLITDYSSTFYDFMLTGNHVIFYAYDFEDYIKNCRGIYFDYFKELQGPFALNEAKLFDLILTIDSWSNEKDYLEKYNVVLTKYNQYFDGNSSKRLLSLMFSDFVINIDN